MTDALDINAATWRSILEDVDEPTVDAVAELLAGQFGRSFDAARDELEDALADPSSPVTASGGALVVDTPADTDTTAETETETDTDDVDGSDAGDADASGSDAVADPSGREFHPNAFVERDWWINWVKAYRYDDDEREGKPTKQPVAPYDHGHAEPVSWRFDLPDDVHPCTSIERVRPWSGMSTTVDLAAPDRVVSDTLGTGIILPRGQGDAGDDDRTILLIDWDDVRDPADGSVHPVVARALDECDGYAEISQSGEGIHQFVYGEVPGSLRTFIRHIDTEPFVGDDLPAVEIYQSGQVCAMTGRHIAGTGDDVGEGQDMVDRLCWEFGAADNAGPGTPTDPYADERDTDDTRRRGTDADPDDGDADTDTLGSYPGDGDVPDHDAVGQALDNVAEYVGPSADELKESVPEDRTLLYHAVVQAFKGGYSAAAYWQLEGTAAVLGERDGLDAETIVADLLPADESPDWAGETRRQVEYVHARARDGHARAARSPRTLANWGVIPDELDDTRPERENQLVALPDVADPDERTGDTGAGDVDAGDELEDPPHGALTVGHARERTKAALVDAFTGDRDVLIEALPSMGKSYGSSAAAVETDKLTTILVGRGNNEQYARIREWCREHGLAVGDKREPNGDVYILPSFKRDCETANGDHGADWEETVDKWYQAGATPKQIHKLGPYALDVDALPCQHDGAACGYTRRWDFDPDEFDVLIGHYSHAHKPKVTGDRAVVVDEFTGAYETQLAGDDLRGAVNQYLDEHGVAARDEFVDDRDGGYLAYQSYADLLLARDDVERRTAAIEWLRRRGVDPDETGAIRFDDDDGKDAAAPLAIYTILKSAAGGSLGNGYERADFRPDVDADRRVGVFNPHGKDRKDGEPAVSILRPPGALAYADVVIGLDGTPTLEMWELMCGRTFDHRVVLEGRRAEYVQTALNFRILPTTDAIKPYNNTEYVNDDHDAALLEAIAAHHDERPAVITTSTALRSWDDAGVIGYDPEPDDPYARITDGPAVGATYHGDVLGSNAFGDERVGAVIGSNHYGDGFVKRWGAYADESVTRQHVDDDADRDTKPRGADLSYGPFGDRIRRHMTEHDTLQAILRFGRDAGGATVYVDTDTLPEWVPTHGRGDVRAVSDGLVGVLDALEDVGPASTAELVDHDAVPIGDSQVRDHLDTLREIGVVETSRDPADGRRHIHHAADTTPVTPTGVVVLPDDVAPPARTRPWSRPDAVAADVDAAGDADADAGRSITGDAYSRSIYVRPVIDPSDEDTPADVPDGRIREVAIPDGGVVGLSLRLEADGGVDDADARDELEDGDLAETDRVALGGLTATGLNVHTKSSDADGDPWYVRRNASPGDVSAHRRGSTPSTRRRSRPAALGRRGGRRGDVARHGPTLIDEHTDDVDELEDT